MSRLVLFIVVFGIIGIPQLLRAQYEGNSPFCHQGGGLLINEISNGPATGQTNNQEYIELIVIPDPANPTAPVNLSGWILDDNNAAVAGEGNAAGHLILGDCYQAVPPGSILVLFNPADRNPDLPADDPTDADQDGVYIIPANDACMQVCNSNPTTAGADYCPCSDPDAPVTAWQIGLRNQGDLFQVRDDCETLVHAISWGGIQPAPDVQNSPTYFRLNGDAQSELVIRFTNFVSDDWNDPTNYDNPSVITGQSPGAPNNTANATFIQSMRSGTFTSCAGTIYDCKQTDAGDLLAPAGTASIPIVLCQGQDLGAFSAVYDQPDENQPQAPGLNFEYAFLLTGDQGPDFPLIDHQPDGDFDFASLAEGTYRIWGFSYIQTNGSVTVDQFLTSSVSSIADILAFFACGYDGDLDSLDQNGLVMEVQVVGAPTAVTVNEPLRSCGGGTTANFDLTAFDALISEGSTLPVVWYTDAAATQVITDPADHTSAAGTVFARLEGMGCNSPIVQVSLVIAPDLGLQIQVDQTPDCTTPLANLSINLANTNGLLIDWNANEWDGNPVLSGVAPGTYSVTVTDPSGCRDTASVRLTPGGMALAEFVATNPSCTQPNGGAIRLAQILGGIGPYQISINGGNFEPAAGWSENGLADGRYTLIIKDATGCENAQTVTLQGVAGLVLDLGPDLELEAGDSTLIIPVANFSPASITVTPQEGITLATTGILVHPAQTTTYTVTAVTGDGCTASDQLLVTVIPPVIPPDEPSVPQQKIFIPNAFSPNEDGVNDTFTVFADEEVSLIKSMRIFDRWGNMLFDQQSLAPNDSQQGWRGELLGRPMPMGVYIYFIELDFTDGHTEIFRGEVSIVR